MREFSRLITRAWRTSVHLRGRALVSHTKLGKHEDQPLADPRWKIVVADREENRDVVAAAP